MFECIDFVSKRPHRVADLGSIGANVVHEYYLTGLVEKLPSAILAGFLMIISVLSFFSGLLLDVIKKIRFENKQVNYQLFKD